MPWLLKNRSPSSGRNAGGHCIRSIYFASDESRHTTGRNLMVDAGET